jgi:hypothetical protein
MRNHKWRVSLLLVAPMRSAAEAATRKRTVSMPKAYRENSIRAAGSNSKSFDKLPTSLWLCRAGKQSNIDLALALAAL